MAKIFVHAAAATAGGGATYLKNVVPMLAEAGAEHEWHLLLPAKSQHLFREIPGRLHLIPAPASLGNPLRRTVYDQWTLRRKLRDEGFDLTIATGNFGMIAPPVPQILLSRNPLYFSEHHVRELRRRRLWKEWLNIQLKRRLALASIRASRFNVPPTAAFEHHIARFGRIDSSTFRPIHHGFDAAKFHGSDAPLSGEYRARLGPPEAARRVLFVSHYNYFRNFETVLRAMPHVKALARGPVQLVLTTTLGEGVFEHRYDTTAAYRLMKSLGVEGEVVMLGHVPYEQLSPLYRACDLAVCPSYAETFGHPMVEAMSSGLPVVATDMDIHREICQDAAVYFSVFDEQALARSIVSVLDDPALAARLSENGRRRSEHFSWRKHVAQMLALVDEALGHAAPSTLQQQMNP